MCHEVFSEKFVKVEEALTAMIYTQEALIDVLVEKEIIAREEIKRTQRKACGEGELGRGIN